MASMFLGAALTPLLSCQRPGASSMSGFPHNPVNATPLPAPLSPSQNLVFCFFLASQARESTTPPLLLHLYLFLKFHSPIICTFSLLSSITPPHEHLIIRYRLFLFSLPSLIAFSPSYLPFFAASVHLLLPFVNPHSLLSHCPQSSLCIASLSGLLLYL